MVDLPVRTHNDARHDARGRMIYHQLHVRFYERVQSMLTFITLASGTVAFSLVFRNNSTPGAIAGGLLALLTIGEHVFKPASKAAEHNSLARRYGELLSRRDVTSTEHFDAEFSGIRADDHIGLDSLEALAYNRNMLESGRTAAPRELTSWQRFITMVV